MTKCFVVTGCTAGLGLELISNLVSIYPNGHYIIICRNINKANSLLSNEFDLIKKADGTVNGRTINLSFGFRPKTPLHQELSVNPSILLGLFFNDTNFLSVFIFVRTLQNRKMKKKKIF